MREIFKEDFRGTRNRKWIANARNERASSEMLPAPGGQNEFAIVGTPFRILRRTKNNLTFLRPKIQYSHGHTANNLSRGVTRGLQANHHAVALRLNSAAVILPKRGGFHPVNRKAPGGRPF